MEAGTEPVDGQERRDEGEAEDGVLEPVEVDHGRPAEGGHRADRGHQQRDDRLADGRDEPSRRHRDHQREDGGQHGRDDRGSAPQRVLVDDDDGAAEHEGERGEDHRPAAGARRQPPGVRRGDGHGAGIGEPVPGVPEHRGDQRRRTREHDGQPGDETQPVPGARRERRTSRFVGHPTRAALRPPARGSAGHGLGHCGEATGGGWPTTDWYDGPRPPPRGRARR